MIKLYQVFLDYSNWLRQIYLNYRGPPICSHPHQRPPLLYKATISENKLYIFVFDIPLKESLHIILMTIVCFEINQLQSSGDRQMIAKENISKNIFSWVPLRPQHLTLIIDLLKREFPICDVQGDILGKPLIFTKGIPHS